MARNLPLSKELVKLVLTLRNVNKWSFSQIGTHFGKTKQWAAYVLASYSEESLSPILVRKHGRKRKNRRGGGRRDRWNEPVSVEKILSARDCRENLWGLMKVWIQKRGQRIWLNWIHLLLRRSIRCVQKNTVNRCMNRCLRDYPWSLKITAFE